MRFLAVCVQHLSGCGGPGGIIRYIATGQIVVTGTEVRLPNTIKKSMDQAKFDALERYGASPLFSDAERAALDYVSELTKDKKIDPDTFARLSRHFSERAICEIVWLVASEHVYNMSNIGLNIHSDMLCHIGRKRRS